MSALLGSASGDVMPGKVLCTGLVVSPLHRFDHLLGCARFLAAHAPCVHVRLSL